MFSWIGSQFHAVLNTYVLGVVTSLMTGLAPIALTAMTLWVSLYGWAVLRNEVPETLPVFVWKVFKVGLILAFALQSGIYISNVSETSHALATGVASTFLPPAANPATIATPYAILDAFNEKAGQLVLDLLKDAGLTRLDLVFAAVVVAFGNVIFLCIALFVVTLANVLLTFVIAIGPLFVLCLVWRPTARFFDSWLSMVLNAVVLTWFAFFALGLSTFMGDALVQTIHDQGGLLGPAFNIVGESLKYCIVMTLMAIICFQAPSLASALTGGTAVQQGIQIIHNMMLVTGQRSASMTQATEGRSSAGGVFGAGTGAPYAVGAAAATSYRLAQRSLNPVRTAAYRRAALRANA